MEILKEWHNHVQSTPVGFTPCFIDGVMAYEIATGCANNVVEHFMRSAPRNFWPTWVESKPKQNDIKF